MSPTTTAIAEQYATADRSLTELIDAVPADRWGADSPCEGWTARDVVRHMVETQRSFFTDRGVDVGDAPDIDADPAAAWRAHSSTVSALVADESVGATKYDGHFGPTTVGETLEHFYVFDMVAHRWDIGRATGNDTTFTDAELDQMEAGIARFGPAIHMEGVCKPGVEAPEGADRSTRVLAALGREA